MFCAEGPPSRTKAPPQNHSSRGRPTDVFRVRGAATCRAMRRSSAGREIPSLAPHTLNLLFFGAMGSPHPTPPPPLTKLHPFLATRPAFFSSLFIGRTAVSKFGNFFGITGVPIPMGGICSALSTGYPVTCSQGLLMWNSWILAAERGYPHLRSAYCR